MSRHFLLHIVNKMCSLSAAVLMLILVISLTVGLSHFRGGVPQRHCTQNIMLVPSAAVICLSTINRLIS